MQVFFSITFDSRSSVNSHEKWVRRILLKKLWLSSIVKFRETILCVFLTTNTLSHIRARYVPRYVSLPPGGDDAPRTNGKRPTLCPRSGQNQRPFKDKAICQPCTCCYSFVLRTHPRNASVPRSQQVATLPVAKNFFFASWQQRRCAPVVDGPQQKCRQRCASFRNEITKNELNKDGQVAATPVPVGARKKPSMRARSAQTRRPIVRSRGQFGSASRFGTYQGGIGRFPRPRGLPRIAQHPRCVVTHLITERAPHQRHCRRTKPGHSPFLPLETCTETEKNFFLRSLSVERGYGGTPPGSNHTGGISTGKARRKTDTNPSCWITVECDAKRARNSSGEVVGTPRVETTLKLRHE